MVWAHRRAHPSSCMRSVAYTTADFPTRLQGLTCILSPNAAEYEEELKIKREREKEAKGEERESDRVRKRRLDNSTTRFALNTVSVSSVVVPSASLYLPCTPSTALGFN